MTWGIIDNTLEGRQKLYFPHWFRGAMPLDEERNTLFRRRAWALTNVKERKELIRKCREDFLFYVYGFVWLFQAKGEPKPVPFRLYDFQVEVLTALWKCLHDGQEDCRIKKPRNVGATWMVITLFEHAWHFRENLHFLLGSRKEDEIDGSLKLAKSGKKAGQWSKLLPKVDFIHLNQPPWLLPAGYTPRKEPYRWRLNISNPTNGCLIAGESANPKFGRSGRYYAIGFDEHAHTENAHDIIASCSQTSDCHIWWSSPEGPDTAFAMLGQGSMRQISLDWWMHPIHSQNMTINVVSGERTSPWFLRECERLLWDEQKIANELLADETKTGGCYYSNKVFDVLHGAGETFGTVRAPLHRGELDVIDTGEGPRVARFCDQVSGRWLFWREFDGNGNPPRDASYIISGDVAAGSMDTSGRGASNSVLAVCNDHTGEIVAEFAGHGIAPHELARLAVAAGWWFLGEDGPAWINFENNGPGQEFSTALVMKLGYENVFRKPGTRKRGRKVVDLTPGWHNGPDSRVDYGNHAVAVIEGSLVERSRTCAEEMRHYQHNPNGKGPPVHTASRITKDPSGCRDNHGDRVVARIGIVMVRIEWKTRPPERQDEPPYGSLAWIEQRHWRELNERMRV